MRLASAALLALLASLGVACAPAPPVAPPREAAAACTLRARFYDVAQGLSVLVDLPDGRHVLVDTGDPPLRSGCGQTCVTGHAHLLESLRRDLAGAPLDLVWATHQHLDHIGGAPAVLEAFQVLAYADNGLDPERPEVALIHRTAEARGTRLVVEDPAHRDSPLPPSPLAVVTPIIPAAWPEACPADKNQCSIGLRVDACGTSILFTGDAGVEEEQLLDTRGPAAVLQVGHHGSETSSSEPFLARVAPRYAVISAGHPGEGTNLAYCHPRARVLDRLNRALGGPTPGWLLAFDGLARCKTAGPEHWSPHPVSDRLWSTSRDGDVVLESHGDGLWQRLVGPGGLGDAYRVPHRD